MSSVSVAQRRGSHSGERRASSRLKTRVGRLSLCAGVLGFILLIISITTEVTCVCGVVVPPWWLWWC